EAVDGDVAGRGVDVDDGDVGAERERQALGIVEDALVQAGLDAGREGGGEVGQPGDLLPCHTIPGTAAPGLGGGEHRGLVPHVLHGRTQGVGGDAPGLGEDPLAAFVDGASPDRHRAGGYSPAAEL